MKCKAAQRILGAYLDGELSAEAHACMAEHLGVCARCTQELERQQALGTLLEVLPAAGASEGFAQSVRREAEHRRAEERPVIALPWAPVPVLVRVAVMVAVVAGVALGGLMSASAASVRNTTAQAALEAEPSDLSTTLLSTVPAGSPAETYLEWMGELE